MRSASAFTVAISRRNWSIHEIEVYEQAWCSLGERALDADESRELIR
jgi:hypothetical protein